MNDEIIRRDPQSTMQYGSLSLTWMVNHVRVVPMRCPMGGGGGASEVLGRSTYLDSLRLILRHLRHRSPSCHPIPTSCDIDVVAQVGVS